MLIGSARHLNSPYPIRPRSLRSANYNNLLVYRTRNLRPAYWESDALLERSQQSNDANWQIIFKNESAEKAFGYEQT